MDGDRVPTGRPILLFDGACNLCHGLVQFVLPRDPEGQFRFASLQSDVGQQLLEDGGLATDDFDTFVMVDGEGYATKSTAALRVLRRLGFPWSLLYAGVVVPRPIRDWCYDVIASNRYGWFGTRELCHVPEGDHEDRFLE